MAISVLCRKESPVDLMASLLLAYYRTLHGKSEKIEWIVEKFADPSLYEALQQFAEQLSDYFDIDVLYQHQIGLLMPDKNHIIDHLAQLAIGSSIESKRIRIHHGAIITVDDFGRKQQYRYFGNNEEGDLVLCDSAGRLLPLTQESSNMALYFHGSLNLCLLKKHGELAHLPWYCLDPGIDPINVFETISPPEGCSLQRFASPSQSLRPSGYSLYDYLFDYSNSESYILESITPLKAKYVKSRKNQGTTNCKFVIDIMYDVVRKRLKANGFCHELMSCIEPCIHTGDQVINKLLTIRALAQMMISCERGYSSRLCVYELPQMSKTKLTKILYNCLLQCFVYIHHEHQLPVTLQELLYSPRPFGLISNIAYEESLRYYDFLFDDCFRLNKATIRNMLSAFEKPIELIRAFDNLFQHRKSPILQCVQGSILEYDYR